MKDWTLADHAEFWQRQRGKPVPCRDTGTWAEMYREWIDWAFSEFEKGKDEAR